MVSCRRRTTKATRHGNTGMEIKDLLQIGSLAVATIGGLIAAFIAILELQRNRRQREIELRWKKAQLAKEILDEIDKDSLIQNAKDLIDRHVYKYKVNERHMETITHEEVLNYLKKDGDSSKEKFIEECLGKFFQKLERIEHFIVINLIDFDDICDPLYWWVKKMSEFRSDYEIFFQRYEYGQAVNFLNRFNQKFKSISEKWYYKSKNF